MPTSSSSSTARRQAAPRRTESWARIASAICHPTVNWGCRLDSGSWNTIEMRAPRMRRIAGAGRASRSTPSNRADPADVGVADELQERLGRHRLARPGFTDDADRLALTDVEGDAADGLDVAVIRCERHPQVVHRQQRIA